MPGPVRLGLGSSRGMISRDGEYTREQGYNDPSEVASVKATGEVLRLIQKGINWSIDPVQI